MENRTADQEAPPPVVPGGPAPGLLCNPYFHCLVLLALGFLVHLPALQGTPLWDDDYLVSENPFIRSPLLIPEAFRHYLFPDAFSYHYRPVQNVSFVFDYFFWNTDAYGFHLTNVLLHLTSGIFLYFLLARLIPAFTTLARTGRIGARLCAFFVALLWIVHPVHSAAVDYISGRADSLAFLLACGGWLLLLRAEVLPVRSRVACYGAAMLCGLLALASREIALVWMGLFLLHTCAFKAGVSRRARLVAFGCCLSLVAAYAGLRQLPAHESGPPRGEPTSAPVRAVLMLRALGDYGRLLVYPSTLYMERTVLDPENYLSTPRWRKSVGTEYLSLLGALVLAGLIYGCVRKGPGQSLRIFGVLWFAFGYLPISNLLDLNATVAEHWLYLPSVGLLLFATGCVLDFPRRGRHLAMAAALVATCAFSARAYIRSTDWVNPKTFYQRTMSAGGSSTRVAVNLGLIYLNNGEYTKAEAIFRRVLELTPDYPTARNNLAEALYRQGKHAEGEAMFASSRAAAPETRKDYPRTWLAALNLAHIRHNEHDDDAALAILAQAQNDYPHIWQIIRFESEVLRQTRGPEAALRLVANFSDQNWWHYGATVALGQLLAEKGDAEAAVEQLRFASWLDVHDAEALRLIAVVRLRQNRFEEARAAQASAISRQPNQPSLYPLLADILFKMGRSEEARGIMARAATLEALGRAQVAAN